MPDSTPRVSAADWQQARESNARTYSLRLPLTIAKARGCFVTDVTGRVFLDCLAGAGALVLGHNHPVVVEAIRAHLAAELPLQTLDLASPLRDEFITELFVSLPPELARDARIQFCGPTGSDGIEAAMKLVKIATGRSAMVAFRGAYHGHTNGSLSLMGNTTPKGIANLMAGVHFMPFPHDYRCPLGLRPCTDCRCAAFLETALTDPAGGIPKPAGVVMEIIQGEAGSNPAPDGFVREVRRITREQDVPLVVDEVQSGWGRTGKLYAIEHSGMVPDVLVLSKALGGGLPLTVLIYHKRLDVWQPGAHAGTFRGNLLAMSTGLATLRFIQQNNLPAHVAKMGARLRGHLLEIQKAHAFIGHVRGLGLMLGAKIVNPEKLGSDGVPVPDHERAARIQQEAFKRCLIIEIGGRSGSVLRFLPPLIVGESEIDRIAEGISAACAAAREG
jgi:diaminobutyrate-2-oxoglutarate transaminase